MNSTLDLTKQAPASARERTAGYVILARMADKGRADIAGTIGEYHFDCPLDNMLFDFKNVRGEDMRKLLLAGSSNQQIAEWLDENGDPKSEDEKKEWSEKTEANKFEDNPEKREWLKGEAEKAGLDPENATLFDFLDADDRAHEAA